MKTNRILFYFCTAAFLAALILKIAKNWTQPLLIQSLESKTHLNTPVYNSIQFIENTNQYIWMMNQSHSGLSASADQWDRVAIVVDKKTNVAEFYQLPPGELQWTPDLPTKQISYRVSCYFCHTNGPRMIRPEMTELKLNPLDRLKTWYWNKKILYAGRIQESSEQSILDSQLKVPFRLRGQNENQTLKVKSCFRCHNDTSGRGLLTRQNILTIKFMLAKKLMPPSSHTISPSDKEQIQRFTLGFE